MVGSNIKEIRLAKGMSISALANKAGISKGYVSDIEKGVKDNPSIEILDRIASALEINVSELFDDSSDKNDNLDELEEDMKILFSKAKKLSKENRQKVLKMMDIFTEENNN